MPGTTPVRPRPMAPPLVGLLASITPERTTDMRWANPEAVVEYMPEGCNEAGAPHDMCTVGGVGGAASPFFTYQTMPSRVDWKPYVLSVTERCSTFSGTDENRARIIRLMDADTERQLGSELWDGALSDTALLPNGSPYPNRELANTLADDLTPPDTNKPPVNALACLDYYLLNNNSGQQGAIHATGDVVDFWNSLFLLERERTERGIRFYSPLGNLVIPSPGYTGTAPDGSFPDNNGTWAYATDMPRIWLGPVLAAEVKESIDRQRNTVEMVAQRPALVEWELCRHAAVRVSIAPCGEGGS